jgi:quinol-cytochrome oxidoreductase complex cytochrome b subunit
MHMLLIPGGLIGLITLHLYLVIRLGVTSPPWSKDAAGEEPVDGSLNGNGRVGLTQPVSRGTGGRD